LKKIKYQIFFLILKFNEKITLWAARGAGNVIYCAFKLKTGLRRNPAPARADLLIDLL